MLVGASCIDGSGRPEEFAVSGQPDVLDGDAGSRSSGP